MQLLAWMKKNETNPHAVAKALDISKTSVYYYAADPPQRMPSPEHMLRIVRLSKGKVTPLDFYPACRDAIKKMRNGKNTNRKES